MFHLPARLDPHLMPCRGDPGHSRSPGVIHGRCLRARQPRACRETESDRPALAHCERVGRSCRSSLYLHLHQSFFSSSFSFTFSFFIFSPPPSSPLLLLGAGHFELLKHLKQNGGAWDGSCFRAAAKRGDLTILRYLHEEKCPYPKVLHPHPYPHSPPYLHLFPYPNPPLHSSA